MFVDFMGMMTMAFTRPCDAPEYFPRSLARLLSLSLLHVRFATGTCSSDYAPNAK